MHHTSHPLARRTVLVKFRGDTETRTFIIEDWWDKLTGKSWMSSNGNPAAIMYSLRPGVPLDDEVVYGHLDNRLGQLVHISEIIPIAEAATTYTREQQLLYDIFGARDDAQDVVDDINRDYEGK